MFLIVGATGLIPNYVVFTPLRRYEYKLFGFNVNIGWVLGILAGATSNYIINEAWTWR